MMRAQRQRGQSLVLASVVLMVIAVVLLMVFSTAQVTRSKMELQNTADATAYSVATIMARDYNFSAYMNRAMVANQVAVSQMVGLTSWFRFTGQTIDNIAFLCAPIPGLDVICAAIAEVYNDFEEFFVASVFPVVVKVLHYWMTALSDLQMVFHLGNIEAIAQNLLYTGDTLQTGVLARNDPDARLVAWPDSGSDIPPELYKLAILIKDASEWWNYTSRYKESQEEMDRFADVTRNSVDDFTKSRSWDTPKVTIYDTDWILDHIPKWLRDLIEKWLPIHVTGSISIGLARRGGTELKRLDEAYSWSAVDTLMAAEEIKIDIKYPCGVEWCCKFSVHGHCVVWWACGIKYCHKDWDETVNLPLGWGAAYSTSPEAETPGDEIFNAGLDKNRQTMYGGAAAGTSVATFELAVAEYGQAPLASFGGMLPYYDISNSEDPASRNRDGPALTLVVSKDAAKVRTAARAGFGAPAAGVGPLGLSNLRLDDPAGTDKTYSIAKGKLHFGLNSQYSNLFSPFWEARLADTTDDERRQAYESLFGWKVLLSKPAATLTNNSGLDSYAP
jgi:hypothetical protein